MLEGNFKSNKEAPLKMSLLCGVIIDLFFEIFWIFNFFSYHIKSNV